MKKLILSAFTIVAFVFYATLSRGGPAIGAVTSAEPPPATTSSVPRQSSTTGSTRVSAAPRQSPATTAAKTGAYKNGSYAGSQADAMFGTVQVKALIQNGRLTDVQFLNFPSDRRRSKSISSQATPILTREAIRAQSAKVQVVSGATLTSKAFVQSLQSALSQAKA